MKKKLKRISSAPRSVFAFSAIAAIATSAFGVGTAWAQAAASETTSTAEAASAADEQPMAEVIVTGSAIKRTDTETALPVTVLKMDDLRKQGLTTVEQILGTLSENQTSLGTSQAVGLSTGGVSQVDLRGIGANKTLVLLNGRRIANTAFDGSAPDLNMIPIAAIDHIDILRDGASSLYGTDAVGGVINFITKKDYQGGTITLGGDRPVHHGGESYNANIGGGYGNLETQGFNIFGFADFQNQNNISGTERPFNTRFPGGLSPTPSPANYFQGDGSLYGNPAAPTCANGLYTIPAGDGTSCEMTTSSFVDYVPKSERASGFLKGDFKLNESNTLSAEYFVSRSEVKTLIAPVPYGLTAMNRTRPDGVANPYYPTTPNIPLDANYDGSGYFGVPLTGAGYDGPAIGCTGATGCTLADLGLASGNGAVNSDLQPGFIWVKWRDVPNGPRGDDNISLQQRVVLSLDGSAGDWDYGAGLSYNHTKTDEKLISGYGSGDLINEGVLDGIINPFGDQTAAGDAYIASALLTGTVLYGTGKTTTADATISNNKLGDWLDAGRDAAVAFGVEYRHEKYVQQANYDYAIQVETSTGIDATTYNAGTRSIYAAYTELDVPLLKSLDMNLAARYDHYSDFGSTTNPKVSLRWQPIQEVVFRAAYSTGFRAPGLYELNATQTYTNTGTTADPVTCPTGQGNAHAPDYCSDQFVALTGGNKDLKPEKSKTFTAGVVAEPISHLSVSADYWHIKMTDLISYLDESVILDPDNYASFSSSYVHRNPNGVLSDVTQLCPGPNCGYIDEREQNLGSLTTDGVDFGANYRVRTDSGMFNFGYNSTWVHKYDQQQYAGGPEVNFVGVYQPVFRWKHTLSVSWKGGAYSAGAIGHLKSGYDDVVTGNDPNGNKIGAFTTVDVYGGWEPVTGLDLLLGVRNLFDRDPPLSYQTDTFQAGYDPRYYDPTGRVVYMRASYNF